MRNLLLFLGLSLCCTGAMAQLRGGLLPIDEAYKVSADIETPGVITVRFVIAPDYYLYRGRMKFIAGKSTTLGEPKLPQGKRYDDPYLGDVETYHNTVVATVPYHVKPAATRIHFEVGYQGCHEVEPKLCYPPHKKTFDLALASAAPVARPPSASSSKAASKATGTATTKSVTSARVPGSMSKAPKASTAPAYDGTPAARAAMAAGDAARNKIDLGGAIANYKKAITLDPDFAEAQKQYAFYQPMRSLWPALMNHRKLTKAEMGKLEAQVKQRRQAMIREYQELATRHPDRAVYPFVLAQFFLESDLFRSERYCHRAVQIDPRFAEGYACLAQIAVLGSDHAKAVEFERKAMQLDPTNADLAASYLVMIKDDPAAFQAAAKQLTRRFPHSAAIFYDLYVDASRREPTSARIDALEQLRRDLPSGGSQTSESIDTDLFRYYVGTDLQKALAIVQEGLRAATKDQSSTKEWKKRETYVAGLLKAQSQIQAGQANAALKVLESVQDQKGEETARTWYLLRAQALAGVGRAAEAVELLRDDFAAQPSDVVLHALTNYGAKLGKTKGEIYNGVWTALKAKAKPAPDFTLQRFDNGKPVSLSGYKGKVVIVDFWYPECGPCRESFPYLQKIAAKFKDKGVTVLAINSVKEQDKLVQPFLRSHRYDFLALKGNSKFAQNVYDVKSFPSTFVIGPDGNIYFRPFIYDDAREHSAEAAIEFLLTRAKS